MTTAGPITPDTKDWTWVLDKPCPECGYDASTVAVADLAHRIRANAVGVAGPDGRARRDRPAGARRLVAAGVRLPRPRRAPGLPRAADRDDDRARAALRQLGPGHDGRRAALRPAGARDRRADPGGVGVRRGGPLRLGPGRRLGSQGHPQRRQRVQHRLAREVPPPRHRAPPARRVDDGGAGDHRLLRRVRRRVRLGHQRHARRGHPQPQPLRRPRRHRGARAGDRLRPRPRRRWRSSRSASASGAPTSPPPSSTSSALPATSPTSSTRSATTSPTRCGAGRRTTGSGPTRPCSTSPGKRCPRCSPAWPPSPGPAARST